MKIGLSMAGTGWKPVLLFFGLSTELVEISRKMINYFSGFFLVGLQGRVLKHMRR